MARGQQIGGTTYVVRVHFNEDAKETMKDKIKSMLENDVKMSQNTTRCIIISVQYYFISDYLQLIYVMIEYKVIRYNNLTRNEGKP